MWRQLCHADALGGFLHHVPNRLHRHAISPCPSNFVDPAEQFSSIHSSCREPIVEFSSHPIRNWNCLNLASLPTRSTMTQCSFRVAGGDRISTPRLHAVSEAAHAPPNLALVGKTGIARGSVSSHRCIAMQKTQSSSVGKVLSTSCALGLLTAKSSLRIFPSRKTSTRLANCAMSCSCVTKTIVSPASFNL